MGRNRGPPGYDKVESENDIIANFIAYKIVLDNNIIGGLFLIPIEGNKMRFGNVVINQMCFGFEITSRIDE